MNELKDIIVILTDTLTLGATIQPIEGKPVEAHYEDASVKPQLEAFLESLKTKNPELMVHEINEDKTTWTGLREVPPEDPEYFTAVVEEAGRQGLSCIVLAEPLLEALKPVLPALSVEDRNRVINQASTLPDEEISAFCDDLKEAIASGKESL